MTDPVDPRRAAFATVAVRALPPAPAQGSEPVLRGVGGPPPPKPAPVTTPGEPGDDEPGEEPEAPSTPVPGAVEPGPPRRAARPSATRDQPKPGAERRYIGTRRGNLVYIQTQITPALSARLDQVADEQDVVLGEVLMAAVRAFRPENPGSRLRRRRRGGNQVRRDIGVLPAEAAEVFESSTAAGLTVSALLRQALERNLI